MLYAFTMLSMRVYVMFTVYGLRDVLRSSKLKVRSMNYEV